MSFKAAGRILALLVVVASTPIFFESEAPAQDVRARAGVLEASLGGAAVSAGDVVGADRSKFVLPVMSPAALGAPMIMTAEGVPLARPASAAAAIAPPGSTAESGRVAAPAFAGRPAAIGTDHEASAAVARRVGGLSAEMAGRLIGEAPYLPDAGSDSAVLDPGLGAELSRSGLSSDQIESIRIHSKAGRPVGINEFLARTPLEANGYVLGITLGGVCGAVAQATGLTSYFEAYAELLGKIKAGVTDSFMELLTRGGDTVVFLVPPDVLTHPEAGHTKAELEWLFAHPDRMENVHFVFGAYDFAPSGLPKPQLIARMAARRGTMPRPSDETRLAQRRRHLGQRDVIELTGHDRLAVIDEFFDAMRRAEFVRDRLSSGRLYFALSGNDYYVLQRLARGLVLELPAAPGGSRKRELFISREQEPELFAASNAKLDAAY